MTIVNHTTMEKKTIRFEPDDKDIKLYHSNANHTFCIMRYNVEKNVFYLYFGDIDGCGDWYIGLSKDDALDFILREGSQEDYEKAEKYFYD